MAIYNEDIVAVELTSGTVHRSFMHKAIGKGDNLANRYGVSLKRNGNQVDMNGCSCQAIFMAPNGQNILISGSSYTGVSAREAWVQLPQACYNYEGQFTLAIKVIGGGVTGTMRIIDGVVDNTGVDSPVAPVESVPTYQEILAVYDELQAALSELDDVAEVNQTVGYLSHAQDVLADLDDAQPNTIYYFMCNARSQLPAHTPDTSPLQFNVFTINTSFVSGGSTIVCKEQYIIDYNGLLPLFHRQELDNTWSDWVPAGNMRYYHLMVQSSGSTRSSVLTDLDNAADNTIYHFLMATTATLPDHYPTDAAQLTQFYVETLTNCIPYHGAFDEHKIQYIIDVPTKDVIAYRTFDDVWSGWVIQQDRKNDYSKSGLAEGYILDFTTGQLIQNQYTGGYAATDFIPVSFGDDVQVGYVQGWDTLCAGCLYNSSKQYIGYFGYDREYAGAAEFKIDDYRVAYVRVNVVANAVYPRANNYVYAVKGSPKAPERITVAAQHQDADGTNVFTKLREACEYIISHGIMNATVHVLAGTYNLVTELADILPTYDGSSRYNQGLQFGNNTHWIFAKGAYVKFLYTGSNENVPNYYSPLVTRGSCILEGLDIEVKNCQYCIHDDWPERESNWIIQYIDCRMKHDGNTFGTYTETVCIGGGLLPNERIRVEGGRYESPASYNYPISYHTVWANLGSTVPAEIIYKDIWLSGGFRLADAPWNCTAVDVTITGCSQGAAIGGTHTMFTITEWNNITR